MGITSRFSFLETKNPKISNKWKITPFSHGFKCTLQFKTFVSQMLYFEMKMPCEDLILFHTNRKMSNDSNDYFDWNNNFSWIDFVVVVFFFGISRSKRLLQSYWIQSFLKLQSVFKVLRIKQKHNQNQFDIWKHTLFCVCIQNELEIELADQNWGL